MIKVPTIEVVIFIMNAHDGQTRMDGSPYSLHPIRCAEILRKVFGVKDETLDQTMLLHDVEEDCKEQGYTQDVLRELFGEPADLAHWLCKDERPAGTDKLEFNMKCYRKIAAEAPQRVRKLKFADRIDNLSDPGRWNPNFRKHYLQDTNNLMIAFNGEPGIEIVRERYDHLIDGKD